MGAEKRLTFAYECLRGKLFRWSALLLVIGSFGQVPGQRDCFDFTEYFLHNTLAVNGTCSLPCRVGKTSVLALSRALSWLSSTPNLCTITCQALRGPFYPTLPYIIHYRNCGILTSQTSLMSSTFTAGKKVIKSSISGDHRRISMACLRAANYRGGACRTEANGAAMERFFS